MTYNLTLVANSTGVVGVMQSVNDSLTGFFGISILLTIFLITFVIMKTKGHFTGGCFASSAFITTICCLLMWGMEIVTDQILFVCIALLAGSLLFLFNGDGN